MTFEHISIEFKERTGIVTVNLPPANSITPEVRKELLLALRIVSEENEALSMVLTGTGERFFMAGAHIHSLLGMNREEALIRVRAARMFLNELASFSKPVIAAINGLCLGGGLEVALCCDIRYASEHAEFGFPEVSIGLMPGGGGTQRLPRIVSPGLARYLIFTGKRISAALAKEAGLIQKVVPRENLLEEALYLAGCISRQAPLALRNAKIAIQGAMSMSFEEGLDLENKLWADLFETSDKEEGIQAFLGKRRPSFRGF
jgi:enoyl-CoA hydratase